MTLRQQKQYRVNEIKRKGIQQNRKETEKQERAGVKGKEKRKKIPIHKYQRRT
jgi:hypothetical protein